MTRPRLLLLATATATVVAAPVAVAKEGFHVYSYGNPKLGLSVSLVRAEGSNKVDANVTQQCVSPEGDPLTVSAELSGVLKDSKIDIKGDALTSGAGTLRVKGTMTLKKFNGKVTINVPIEGGDACKVSKKFTAKHTFTTGG